MKTRIDKKEGTVTFVVDTNIYSQEVLFKACYVFIDKAYVMLDKGSKAGTIEVCLKSKTASSEKILERLEGEFFNELLNCLVREKISKSNKKIMEQIVGGAMAASIGLSAGTDQAGSEYDEMKEIENAVEALKKELALVETQGDYTQDKLGIATIIEATPKQKKGSRKQ